MNSFITSLLGKQQTLKRFPWNDFSEGGQLGGLFYFFLLSIMNAYYVFNLKSNKNRDILVVQLLGLRASTAGVTGSIPGQGTKIPHAVWRSQQK